MVHVDVILLGTLFLKKQVVFVSALLDLDKIPVMLQLHARHVMVILSAPFLDQQHARPVLLVRKVLLLLLMVLVTLIAFVRRQPKVSSITHVSHALEMDTALTLPTATANVLKVTPRTPPLVPAARAAQLHPLQS